MSDSAFSNEQISQLADAFLVSYPNARRAELVSTLVALPVALQQILFVLYVSKLKGRSLAERRAEFRSLDRDSLKILDQLAQHVNDVLADSDKAYHAGSSPKLTDAQYDSLKLFAKDLVWQRFHLSRFLTQLFKKGAPPSEKFTKVLHRVQMLSLSNGFSDNDVRDFVSRIRRFLNLGTDVAVELTAEPKIDGLSISLRYEDGKLAQAATRGDGFEGENVTANVLTIEEVPRTLP